MLLTIVVVLLAAIGLTGMAVSLGLAPKAIDRESANLPAERGGAQRERRSPALSASDWCSSASKSPVTGSLALSLRCSI